MGLMSRLDLASRCQQRIAELDRLLSQLRADLPRLWSAQPPEAALTENLSTAARLAADLRAALAAAAQGAHRALPPWSDRASLQAAPADLLATWAARESGVPRVRLRHLADAVERGRLQHRLPAKAARLERARAAVPPELRQACERDAPPTLPGPSPDQQDWLAWAWAL